MASGHGVPKPDKAHDPGRQVHRSAFVPEGQSGLSWAPGQAQFGQGRAAAPPAYHQGPQSPGAYEGGHDYGQSKGDFGGVREPRTPASEVTCRIGVSLMAAPDALHPKQLSMFMPARELYDMTSLDAAGYNFNVETMRKQKRRANKASKLGASIENEGVRKPVQIVHGSDPQWNGYLAPGQSGRAAMAVANGNHRVVQAYDLNPDTEIPVSHYDNSKALFEDMRHQDRGKW